MRRIPLHLFVLLTTLCAAPLTAQLTTLEQADFDGPTYDPAVSMGGPNLLLGIKLQAASTYTASRIEVFTGKGRGSNTLAIWSHDPNSNQPLAQLGVGSWEMSRLNGWQGAVLGTPVQLTQGQDFWLVWGCINGSQCPTAGNGPGAQAYRGSFDGGQSWNGPFTSHQWKLRIYSGLFPGHYEVFGSGCSGSSRTTPELGWDGQPLLGNSMSINLDSGSASSFALLTIGLSDTVYNALSLPYDLSTLGAPGCFLRTSVGATLFASTDASGDATATLPIPNTGALIGINFYDQWFVYTAGANTLGFLTSNGGVGQIGL